MATKTISTALQSTWNVQCAEVVFDWKKVGDMSSVDYHLIGKLSVPANSYILDVQVHGIALWVSGAAVSLKVGDGDDDDGFHDPTNLKASDLLVGEANTVEHSGGLEGAYTTSEQRVFYSSSARTVTADITLTTHATAVSQGETRVLVLYCCPPSDSVKP